MTSSGDKNDGRMFGEQRAEAFTQSAGHRVEEFPGALAFITGIVIKKVRMVAQEADEAREHVDRLIGLEPQKFKFGQLSNVDLRAAVRPFDLKFQAMLNA